jgi:hypothetical protein
LGRWYEHGIGKENFSQMPSYASLEKPHAIVHRSANELATECASGKALCSKKVIEDKVHMIEKASGDVFKALDEMIAQRSDKMMKEAVVSLFQHSKGKV